MSWGLVYMMAMDEQDCTAWQIGKLTHAIRSLQCTREEARVLLANRLEQQREAFVEMAEAFGAAANDDDGFDDDEPEPA